MQLLTSKNFHLTQVHEPMWSRLVYVDIPPNDTRPCASDCDGRASRWNSWILAALGKGRSIQLVMSNWPSLVTDDDSEVLGPLYNNKLKLNV